MMQEQSTFAAYIKSLQILFYFLIGGQLTLVLIIGVLGNSFISDHLPTTTEKPLVYSVAVVQSICLVICARRRTRKLNQLQQETDTTIKLNDYRKLFITEMAIKEFTTLYALIILFVTGVNSLWIFVVIGLLSALSLQPRREKVEREMGMNEG